VTIDQAPVIVDGASASWESWPPDQLEQRGDVQWKTLISAGLTPSGALTAGVARLTANGRLRPHHHEQAEIYVIVKGSGTVMIDGTATDVAAGTTVFIPGSAVHSIEATGGGELRFAYVLAADAFEDVTYVFDTPTE
jgi:mannose-6-phosphate isomerase-like protein (cupin superfamily)